MKRHKTIVGVLLLGVSALVCFWIWNSEPRYHGRALSSWIDDLQAQELPNGWIVKVDERPETESGRAVLAIRGLGTKALPQLERDLQQRSSGYREMMTRWLESKVKLGLKSNREVHQDAARACYVLGPLAAPLIPDLLAASCTFASDSVIARMRGIAVPYLLSAVTGENAFTLQQVESAFGSMGVAQDGVPAALAFFEAETVEVRLRVAALALTIITADADTVVPDLKRHLKSPLADKRRLGAWALGEFEERARSAAPELLALENDADSSVRWAALIAALNVDPAAAASHLRKMIVVHLDNGAHDFRFHPRVLLRAATRSSAVKRELERLTQDSDPRIRAVAETALNELKNSLVLPPAQALEKR